MYLDGLCTQYVVGVEVVIIDPKGVQHCYSFLLDYKDTTINRAEYEALIIGLEILMEVGLAEVKYMVILS